MNHLSSVTTSTVLAVGLALTVGIGPAGAQYADGPQIQSFRDHAVEPSVIELRRAVSPELVEPTPGTFSGCADLVEPPDGLPATPDAIEGWLETSRRMQ